MIGDEFGRMNGRRGTPHDVETGRDRLTDFTAAIKPSANGTRYASGIVASKSSQAATTDSASASPYHFSTSRRVKRQRCNSNTKK
jgi:hypothetical protein